jgi:hypothetical protein
MPLFEVALIDIDPETKQETLIGNSVSICVTSTAEAAGQKILVQLAAKFSRAENIKVLCRPFLPLPQWK